ncbi:hypothetical protein CesoFtcFv8_025224 [Champsocephalus esox]|uniref:Uncharacterized protein n=1 Tax=Champsocephalus esox TaxID=159716 RepID=A0AAN8GC44_9TELE|nr:hypothetical protein CesoFtcFv8_025224 [Champsocephalus esox]
MGPQGRFVSCGRAKYVRVKNPPWNRGPEPAGGAPTKLRQRPRPQRPAHPPRTPRPPVGPPSMGGVGWGVRRQPPLARGPAGTAPPPNSPPKGEIKWGPTPPQKKQKKPGFFESGAPQ